MHTFIFFSSSVYNAKMFYLVNFIKHYDSFYLWVWSMWKASCFIDQFLPIQNKIVLGVWGR